MTEINVLILSAGRRVELIQAFQKAGQKLNIKSNVVAGDCSDTAPALYFADRTYKLPFIHDPNYINSIINVCNNEDISLIIPTIDTDLLLLAENKIYIEKKTNAKVLISDLEVIEICRDKVNTQKFLEKNNFSIPKMYNDSELLSDNVKYPLFIKPISGSSSINTFKVNNKKELNIYRDIINKSIIQDYIEGEEYTVDVFLDFESNIISIVPRLRMAIRSGEISKGKILKDREIIDNITQLMKILKPIGHITVQLMKTKNGIQYIEINPRFGGGAPMSIQSGADSCENLFRLLMGEKLEYNENYKDNITFLRFDQSVCLDENMELL
ncbi:ATP-grasp domain-containing protein [uncultured Psychrobacillus sp.]|uniref:ATP-grasp domain-containing protein n=1 Tax=uncultured Psychrobacillus sp. TaxID=1551585 RepID=UPI002610C54F|nr:ATP-grasp domain-containing protein [uncultured Psychrobacillus sp.]